MRSLLIGLVAPMGHTPGSRWNPGDLIVPGDTTSENNTLLYDDFMRHLSATELSYFLARIPVEWAVPFSIIVIGLFIRVLHQLRAEPITSATEDAAQVLALKIESSRRHKLLKELNIDISDLPDDFQCPISQLLITEIPVYHKGNPNQQRFDRDFITLWLQKTPSHPINRQAFNHDEMGNDYLLNARIVLCLEFLKMDKLNFIKLSLDDKKETIGKCIKFIDSRLKDVTNNSNAVDSAKMRIRKAYVQYKKDEKITAKNLLSTSHLLSHQANKVKTTDESQKDLRPRTRNSRRF